MNKKIIISLLFLFLAVCPSLAEEKNEQVSNESEGQATESPSVNANDVTNNQVPTQAEEEQLEKLKELHKLTEPTKIPPLPEMPKLYKLPPAPKTPPPPAARGLTYPGTNISKPKQEQ